MSSNDFNNANLVEIQSPVFELYQNFPNPFNIETTIRYHIPVSSYVELKVFAMLGCEIVTLIDEVKNAGMHEIKFHANKLETGIYLYRIKACNFVCIKKMILLNP